MSDTPKIQIPNLPSIPTLNGDEQFIAREGNEDGRLDLDQVKDYVLSHLNAKDIMALIKPYAPGGNGFNANFLQGLTSAFLRNAGNLNTGTISAARLPQGSFTVSFTNGGEHPSAGILRCALKLPPEMFNGARVMIQGGWTAFIKQDRATSVTFKESFVSGFGGENKPIVFVVPECRSEIYGNTPTDARERAELTMRLYESSLSSFSCASTRTRGANADTVRGVYFALGLY